MNKKLILLISLLLIALFVISACQQGTVGRRTFEGDTCKMVWHDENGLIRRTISYNPGEDNCDGYRPYLGKKMVAASCLNINECNSNKWIGECKSKEQLKSLCKSRQVQNLSVKYKISL